MPIGLNEAQLVSLFLASAFWGMFLPFYLLCLKALLFSKTDTGCRLKRAGCVIWPMVIAVNAMFVVGTLDVSLALYSCIKAFVKFAERGGPDAVFKNVSNWTSVVRICTAFVQGTIGDIILIYRCWLVYNRCWPVVIFPILLLIGATTTSTFAVHFACTLRTQDTVNADKIQPFVTSTMVLSICVNLITTGLIVFRIWLVTRKNRRMMAFSHLTSPNDPELKVPLNGLRRAMFTIIESGLLYTGASAISFITYMAQDNSNFITGPVQIQIAGIAFCLIIVRASSATDNQFPTDNSIHLRVPASRSDSSNAQSRTIGSEGCPDRPPRGENEELEMDSSSKFDNLSAVT